MKFIAIGAAFLVGYAIVSVIISFFQTRSKIRRNENEASQNGHKHRDSARRNQYDDFLRQKRMHRSQKDEWQEAERIRRREQEEFQHRRGMSDDGPSQTDDEKHYGRILGLRGAATFIDVKERYKILASQYHPDKVNHLGPKLRELSEMEMKRINEAFDYFKRKYG